MIDVTHISKKINDQDILKDISIHIPDGEILVILGGSGAGKSVLLQHMIGLMKPTQGTIALNGKEITSLSERELLKIRKDIGYLFQDGALYDFMTVYDNVAFPLREHAKLKEHEITEKVRSLLRMVELEGAYQKYPAELSGGMRKRAALARAIVLDSKILFCDEPTSGLDPILSRDIATLIFDVARKLKCTMVIASHDVPNSFRIADRMALIKQGRLVALGSKEDFKSSKDPYVREFFNG